MDILHKKHPDSALGVLQMLEENSSCDLKEATCIPDPEVRGVWLVNLLSGQRVVAYLAGYPDPWGTVREINDFEINF